MRRCCDTAKPPDSDVTIQDQLHSFARKPLPAKWATIRAKTRRAIRPEALLLDELRDIKRAVERSAIIAKERYVAEVLRAERYADPKRLERYGFKVYSQSEEDGIIQEIFRRIGTTDRRFVEFGVEEGLENNTLKLLLEGWSGLWIEGSRKYVDAIERRFADVLGTRRLAVRNAFITTSNVNELIGAWGEGGIDLLSIDIDGNDYYVWEALTVVRPRLVVVEYNGKFPPPLSVVQDYNASHVWTGTDYMGASLEALVRLGKRLGYCLVGTNFVGANAFFVRADLAGEKFQRPFTAENHYNPARYFLWQLYVSGHPPDWGRYVTVPDADAQDAAGHEPR